MTILKMICISAMLGFAEIVFLSVSIAIPIIIHDLWGNGL